MRHRILTRPDASGDWTANGTHAAASGAVVNRVNLNTTSVGSHYAIADTSTCTPPVTSAITGNASACANETGITYSVVFTGGSTYNWTITGGSIVSGQGTSTIDSGLGQHGYAG